MTEKHTYLSAVEILNFPDREPVEEYIPAWNTYIRLAPLTAQDRVRHQNELAMAYKDGKLAKLDSYQCHLVVKSAVDADGKPLFNMSQLPALLQKHGGAIEQIYRCILEISGMAAEDVEDAAKNSLTTA